MISPDKADNQETARLLTSDSEDDAKASDAVSLSTCSMSTIPTPDNPLFARGVAVTVTGIGLNMNTNTNMNSNLNLNNTNSNSNNAGTSSNANSNSADGNADPNDSSSGDAVTNNVIENTKRLAINDSNNDNDGSNNASADNECKDKNEREYNDHNDGSCLPSSVVTTAALHEAGAGRNDSDLGGGNGTTTPHSSPPVSPIGAKSPTGGIDIDIAIGAGTGTGGGLGAAASPIGASFLLSKSSNSNNNSNSNTSSDSLNSKLNGVRSSDGNVWHSSPLRSASPPPPIPDYQPSTFKLFSPAPSSSSSSSSFRKPGLERERERERPTFKPKFACTRLTHAISRKIFNDTDDDYAVANWLGFWALFNVSCANYVLKPIMDSVVLQLGVENLASLTFAGTILSFLSSVPIGWLFEAPDPKRRKVFKKMGMTRGETQGTSLALFYRFFALSALSYAYGFLLVDWIRNLEWIRSYEVVKWMFGTGTNENANNGYNGDGESASASASSDATPIIPFLLDKLGKCLYVAFFLLVTLMTRHSTSLVWGVTTEAMEYEEIARKQRGLKHKKTQLQRLNRIQFGGTIGGIWGSVLASSLAKILHLPGLLFVSAVLLEISAQLSIELGRIMQQHWEDQIRYRSSQDLTSLDSSMKRSSSVGSMKRVASGNSLFAAQQQQQQQEAMKRVASGNSISGRESSGSLASMINGNADKPSATTDPVDDNTFWQRLFRGVTTILESYLLMTIFTYNALFSSTTTLLSFQRAELVANRKQDKTVDVSADTAFLAKVNMGSSVAMFAIQSSGAGASITQRIGLRGSLALMPFIRLGSLICLCWWHRSTNGQPPNLILFLMLDEFTKIINLAVAKPVRESLWRGMSSEARYEAKPIIDVLANRWGAGSASVCVHAVSWVLLFLGQKTTSVADGSSSSSNVSSTSLASDPVVFGLPPVLFLGLIVSAWWVGVSLDLGDRRIKCDSELEQRKKNQ